MSGAAARPGEPAEPGRPHRIAPTTRGGRRAVVLAIVHVALMLWWRVLPGGAGLGLLFGIGAGVLAVLAIVRDHERAWSVFAALLPLILVIGFVLGEFAVGHD